MITDHSIYMVYGAPQTNLTQGSGGGGGGGGGTGIKGGGEAQGSSLIYNVIFLSDS